MVVTRFTVFETRGGAVLTEVEPAEFHWSEQSNSAETVDMTFVDHVDEWRNLFTPWKHSIAVEVGGHVLGGPIIPADFDGDEETLRVAVRGFRYMLDRMPILPAPASLSGVAGDWLAPNGTPATSFDTIVSGVDRGTIGKRLVQQACSWPGWDDIPITFHTDRAGTHEQTYAAVDRKTVESALKDLSAQMNGPDIRVQLRRTSEDKFGWVYESGTETQPRLQADAPFVWDARDTSGLSVRLNPNGMGSVSWAEGGRATDQVLIRMMYDPYLVDQGFPLLHLESDASTNTSRGETLDSWNAEALRTGRRPGEFWSFRVPAGQSPLPSEYGCGDLAEITLSPMMQVRAGLLSGSGVMSGPGLLSGAQSEVAPSGFLESRTYVRRIVGMSGGSGSDLITLVCGEAYDG